MALMEQFGNIDIYLFDQLLRGNIAPGMRVLDAGCGGGRNLVYLLRQGYEVFGGDRGGGGGGWGGGGAGRLAPGLVSARAENFRVEAIEAMSFADGTADVVLCNSVLHFARDDAQFEGIVRSLWRDFRRGGVRFWRLASWLWA